MESPTAQATELHGVTKAAILLVSMTGEVAADVLRHLDDAAVEEITREIAQLDLVGPEARGKVVEEFYNIALARSYAKQGGLAYAKMLLQKALPGDQASNILKLIEHQVHRKPFSFLAKTDADNLTTFIQDEHPQTIALILSHLTSTKASEILSGLPLNKQIEVVTRIANMDNTNPEVIREVEQGLEARLSGLVSQTFQKVGGVESVAEMLNLADRATEKGILEALDTQDPDLVEQIRRLMFVFEDILLVNDKGIQQVLKEIENDDLSLALKTASEPMRDKIFRNMSERAAQLIKEDMEFMGPVRVSDVERAQQKIVDVVRRLEDAGELIISGRGGEKAMIV
jgi:flagellar motor switch protein FliG